MANFANRVQEMLRSPKTREMIDKAKATATRPENREKLRQLSSKFTGRRRHHAGTTAGTGTDTTAPGQSRDIPHGGP